jgi:1,2-dihydroxy-3-keto-5-methylthiopentene dioxygenase
MAILRVPDQKRTLDSPLDITAYLADIGIQYEQWYPNHKIAPDAAASDILDAYSKEIERLKSQGGYVTADVVDVHSATPGLDAMLAKFNREHWHDEDEVRFIIDGRGVFHIRPEKGPVVAIEVEPADLIRVPRATLHWFNLCPERRIRAIRLFQDPSGWTPHYSESGMDRGFDALCLGTSYISSTVP